MVVELPVIQSCNRCGECCRVGGECAARVLVGLPAKFEGRCEVLEDNMDGTTNCPAIAKAFASNGPERIWISLKVYGDCDFPELRKEICAA